MSILTLKGHSKNNNFLAPTVINLFDVKVILHSIVYQYKIYLDRKMNMCLKYNYTYVRIDPYAPDNSKYLFIPFNCVKRLV